MELVCGVDRIRITMSGNVSNAFHLPEAFLLKSWTILRNSS
jgi:hypothetical protein